MKRAVLFASILVFLFFLVQNTGAKDSNVTSASTHRGNPSLTVHPHVILQPVITPSTANGAISACVGSASASPNIKQITVSGSNLTGDIMAMAPADFEVSLTAGGGYGNSVTLTQTGGTVSNKIVYVRSAASAAAGGISGSVTLTSTGATNQDVLVTGVVNALPTVNQVPDQTPGNGSPTAAVNFTGTANTFTWTNSTPSIGLPAAGMGDIASFTAVNNGNTPITATITVTPLSADLAYLGAANSKNVEVYNMLTGALVTTIIAGSDPNGIAISGDGGRIYAANYVSNSVSVIDAATNSIISTIPVDKEPIALALSHDGRFAYVANDGSHSVSVINILTNQVVTTVQVGDIPEGIVVSPDNSRVYVVNHASGTVSVIDATANMVISTIKVGSSPIDLCISADGSKIYVPDYATNIIDVINTATNTISTVINVQMQPEAILLSPDGSKLYLTNNNSNTVSVINTANNTVIANIPVDSAPSSLGINADGSKVYVENSLSNTISVINTVTNQVVSTFNVAPGIGAFGNFIKSSTGCTGTPITFTITVTPKLLPPGIAANEVLGNISACEGTASESPDILQFNASGSNLTGDLIITASTGFEVSLAPGSGYADDLTLSPTGGNVSSTVIYVRSAATAAGGKNSGTITLSSAGANDVPVAVTANVNPAPTINQLKNLVVDNGSRTTAVNITGTANAYKWTNDTPAIGLAAGGSGNIPSFTAVNTGNTPVVATITVTPLPAPPVAFAYITSASSNTVSVINTQTNQVVNTIAVGVAPEAIAVSPDGSRVYVANVQSNNVTVIDASTRTVIATIPVGSEPASAIVSPDGSKLYVSNDINVSVINTASNTLITNIPIGEYPNALAISPDGSRLYLTNAYGNSNNNDKSDFYVINTATNAIVAIIAVGVASNGVVVSPDGKLVYVANTYTDDISVIDATTNTVVSAIPVGTGPLGLCISADGSRLYVTDSGDQESGVLPAGKVSVINTATRAVIATVPVDDYPIGISLTPDGSELYVINDFGMAVPNSGDIARGTVSVIDPINNTIKTTVTVGYNAISFGDFMTNYIGCSGVPVTFTITVNPAVPVGPPGVVVIPNTFTPNGDGINDTWNIKSLDTYPNCSVVVFNRWGQNVYQSKGYGVPWDGTFNGSKLPAGTYYYVINLKNDSKLLSGFVAIIR